MNWKMLLRPWHNETIISNEEIQSLIRQWRNTQLEISDWTQLADVAIFNKEQWAQYRQELRQILKQNNDPKLIVFPEPPK